MTLRTIRGAARSLHPGWRVEGLLFLKTKDVVFMEVWNYAYVLTIPSIYVQMYNSVYLSMGRIRG